MPHTNEQRVEHYWRRRRKRLCVQCGAKAARGKSMCERHLAHERERCAVRREESR